MYKSLWFSGLGAGFSSWSPGIIPGCIHNFFSARSKILPLLSSSWSHNILYSILLAGNFRAKQTQQKVMECSKVSSSIIQTHKKPLQTHNYLPAGFQKKKPKFYGNVTLVNEGVGLYKWELSVTSEFFVGSKLSYVFLTADMYSHLLYKPT